MQDMDRMSGAFGDRRSLGELFLTAAVYGAAYLSVFLLLGMIAYLFFRGFGVLDISFFTSVTSIYRGTVGIAGNLVNTVYILVLALFLAVPVGVGAAIYLNEYIKPGPAAWAAEFAFDALAGIPSVLFGLFGMVFFGNVLGLGYSILNGAMTLALMVLPMVVRNTKEALNAVPDSMRNGALGMGATKWYMIRTILLPAALPGILTGVILSIGRIVGESAALLFTAGSARLLPRLEGAGLIGKIWESGGTLAVELYLQMQNGEYDTAFGIACVLLILALALEAGVKWLCPWEK